MARVRLLQPGVLLAMVLLAGAPALAQATQTGTIGRWQGPAGHCRLSSSGGGVASRRSGCRWVRIDQHERGLLSIRFMGSPVRLGAGQLIFAGSLRQRGAALKCRDDRCVLRPPIQLKVSAVGEQGPIGTPQQLIAPAVGGRLARGSCRINRGMVRCEASQSDGRRWQAQARLR